MRGPTLTVNWINGDRCLACLHSKRS